MKYPNLFKEKRLWKKGFKRVAGLDEAGRGPLAGPVTAAVVSIIANCKLKAKSVRSSSSRCDSIIADFKNLKDSKKLSPKKREEFYKILKKNPAMEWGIGKVSEKVIDKINILEATKLAMIRAIKNLESRIKNKGLRKLDYLILDGNFKIDINIPQKSIIKADEKVFSCALASVLAKVYRDRIMERYDKKYPQYGFKKHKGYPTKLHLKMLKKYGPSKIHRKTFGPVKSSKRKR